MFYDGYIVWILISYPLTYAEIYFAVALLVSKYKFDSVAATM